MYVNAYENYVFPVTANTCLETRRTDAIKTVENVEYKFNIIKCSTGNVIHKKFEQVSSKNLGFETLLKISKIMLREKIAMDDLPDDLSNINFFS